MPETWGRNVTYTDFVFLGFSGSREWRQLLLIIFTVMFSISIPTNTILIFTIISKKALHSPMYTLIAVLSAVDLSIPIIFVPHMLCSLILKLDHISLIGCQIQMFCVHFLGFLQSTILLWMALDRYYAICKPLHYNEYMSFKAFLKFVLITLLRNTAFPVTVVSLAGSLTFCQKEINHCFCEHMALVSLACGSTYVNNIIGLTSTFAIRAVDFFLIFASYITIFFSVFKSGNASKKGLSTCITHIVVMTLGLIFALTSFLAYRIKNDMSTNDRIILSTMYLLCPSCLHPIIYGYMIKEIRVNIINMLKFGKVDPHPFKEKKLKIVLQ